MTASYRRYLDELSRRSGYRVNWLPTAPLRIGDVGALDGPLFDRRTSLSELEVEFRQRRGKEVALSFQSEGDTRVHLGGEGGAGADVSVEFATTGAFLFQASGCVETQIEDLDALVRKLVAVRDLQERWHRDWSLVDTVVRADCMAVAIAESQLARLEVQVDLPLDVSLPLVSNGSCRVAGQSGEVFHLVGARAAAPLYRTRRFRRSFLDWLRGREAVQMARASLPPDLRADEVFEAEDIR